MRADEGQQLAMAELNLTKPQQARTGATSQTCRPKTPTSAASRTPRVPQALQNISAMLWEGI